MANRLIQIIKHPILRKQQTLLAVWILIGLLSGLTKLHRCNNFLIFKGEFWHVLKQMPIYESYPDEYFDICHYGPLFSIIIAPFAVVPTPIGLILWTTTLSLLLYLAIRRLPISSGKNIFILWFVAHELLTALFMQQFNVAIAAIIIGSYLLIEKKKDHWATLLIIIGTFVKLYGIVGLAFFFFSHHKTKFMLSLLGWSILAFILPMIISSPEYITDQYIAWFTDIVEKNGENADSIAQNISVMGMAHRISGMTFSDLWIILPAMALFALPYLRYRQYKNQSFREMILASVLMFVCLFSTGTESSGYIIALTGVGIWYCCAPWQRNKWDIALLIFAFVITSLSPSDLFPRFIRQNLIQPYALKALPVFLIWLKMSYEILVRDYRKQ